jgi:hypothetical protein
MTEGNASPNREPPDVTRFKAEAAKRVQAHRWRRAWGCGASQFGSVTASRAI